MKQQKKEIHMAGPWMTKEEKRIVVDALENGWYGSNAYNYCEMFEKKFARYHKRKYSLMTPNCTTAIHLGLASLNIGKGDEVIVPECTWIGSCAGVIYQNANIVFADIDKDTWCLSASTIKDKITSRTKLVIVVNLYGNMADWNEILRLQKKYNFEIFEDAAESLGSSYGNVKSGKFGLASFFSFHRTKTLSTGEGGMMLTDNKKLFERAKFLRDHGRRPGSYFTEEVAFKYMPFNLQAALGYAQLKRIKVLVKKKRDILKTYKKHLSSFKDVQMNNERKNTINGAWCSTIVFGKSYKFSIDKLKSDLKKNDLPSRNFFYPLSSLPAFNQKKKFIKLNPMAYSISSRGINLPSALNLEKSQIEYYCKKLKKILSNYV